VQRRDLVVKLLATFIEATACASGNLGAMRNIDATALGEICRDLEHVERATRIAIGC
jgi:hypothetical protein